MIRVPATVTFVLLRGWGGGGGGGVNRVTSHPPLKL